MASASFSSTKDSWMRQDASTTNYGSETYIEVFAAASKRRAIISFDVSSVIPTSATITLAELRLYCSSGTSGRTVTCYRLLQTVWVESEVTWQHYAGTTHWTTDGALSDGNDYTSTDAATYVSEGPSYTAHFDVKNQVQTAVSSLSGGVHFLLADVGAEATAWQDYASKEEETESQRPILYVEWVTGPASLKTVNGLAKASVKTINGLAIASVKTWNGLA